MPDADFQTASQKDASKYEILRVVNRGGMGEIALARVRGTKGFEKLVVLKRLRADAEREDHRQMFDIEAELMSRIEHPNIVQVFDQPVVAGIQYLAMGYVRGRNLDQLIRRTKKGGERLGPQFCLTIVCEVLRGLAFVHRLKDEEGNALGVVHQDITPSNIMVSFFGEVKITDFGIAYVTSRDGGRRKGVLKGKPRYVSPEVLAGRRVNNRADIYGVAVVLYEMLAGRALFARPSVDDTLAAVARNELPDFAREFPHIGPGLVALMRRALAKDPQDRFRTAEEMFAETTAELAKIGGPMPPSHIGYILRKAFHDAPDLPEADPILDAALEKETKAYAKVTFRAPDLEQTLSELDRLLGGGGESQSSSHELFSLPPELANELDELDDMDPFDAKTPIPELALSGPNGEELLMNAIMKGTGNDGGLFGPLGGLPVLPPLSVPTRPTPTPPPLGRRATGQPPDLGSPATARPAWKPDAPIRDGKTNPHISQLDPLSLDDPLAKSVIARSRRAKLSAKPAKPEGKRDEAFDSGPRSIEEAPSIPPEALGTKTSSVAPPPHGPNLGSQTGTAEIKSADVPIEAPVEADDAAIHPPRLDNGAATPVDDKVLREALAARAELEAKTRTLEANAQSLESKAQTFEAKAQALEVKAQSLETKSQTLEANVQSLEAQIRDRDQESERLEDARRRAMILGFTIGLAVGAAVIGMAWSLAS